MQKFCFPKIQKQINRMIFGFDRNYIMIEWLCLANSLKKPRKRKGI